jgi:lipopolysaccharide biosynthesis glycosyltransferase
MTDKKINILMCSDERGVAMMHMSLKTIFDSNRYEDLEVHIITDGFSEASTEKINVLGKHFNRKIVVHTITAEMIGNFDIPYLNGKPWPIAATFRLMMGRLLPDLHRVIYLDIDTMTRRSLLPLWLTDLEGCVVGGVEEFADVTQAKLGNPPEYPYINSGVLLVDLDLWRALGLDTKIIAAIADHPEKYFYFDQDAINHLLYDKIKPLPAVYNATMSSHYRYHCPEQDKPYQDFVRRNPTIVHFTGPIKPWDKCFYPPAPRCKRAMIKHYIAMEPKTEGLWGIKRYYRPDTVRPTLFGWPRYAVLKLCSFIKQYMICLGICPFESWRKTRIYDPYPDA